MSKVTVTEAIERTKQETAREIFDWLETRNRAKEDITLGVSCRGLSITFDGAEYWYQKQKYGIK